MVSVIDLNLTELARRHNNANVLAMGARVVAVTLALEIVEKIVATAFEGGRHVRRLKEIRAYEEGTAPRPPVRGR